ncbi:hypothetical protein FPQ18DRAFT_120304 [Pyronema domesticum]|nr:hypothetical protein FPQ18DRAFT_120304 [Pyronema domesticum]
MFRLSRCSLPRSSSFGSPLTPHLRSYATPTSTPPDIYRWPSNPYPTPYEILSHYPNKPYSKARYTELLKIYHPDHAHHYPAASHRKERFFLIQTAHHILSSPQRRADYDRYYTGWPIRPPRTTVGGAYPSGAGSSASSSSSSSSWWTEREGRNNPSEFNWGGPQDARNNANWEDWERWYAAKSHTGDQKELYARNGTVVSIIVIMAFVGSFAELNYAHNAGQEAVVMGEKQSQALGRDMQRRMIGTDRDERVKRFLMQKDPVEARKFIGKEGGIEVPKLLEAPPPPTRPVREDH